MASFVAIFFYLAVIKLHVLMEKIWWQGYGIGTSML